MIASAAQWQSRKKTGLFCAWSETFQTQSLLRQPGGMSVHKKADGRWYVQWRDKATGRVVQKYYGRGVEAERQAREQNSRLGLRAYVERTPKRASPWFYELVDAYMAAKANDMAATTLDVFFGRMSRVILPELASIQAIRMTPAVLDRYVQKRLRSVKKTTVHRELSDIQAVLNWAADRKYISHNPVARYRKPRRDDAVIMPPTQTEIAAIMAKAAHHIIRAICLAYYTGLRPGRAELLCLKWDAVDWDAGTLHVLSARKGGPRWRTVPLHPGFTKQLVKWHAADMANYGSDPGYERWIVHYRGREIKRIVKGFRATVRRAGISRRIRPYDLRHGFVTAILSAGGDLKAVSQLAGHSRPDTTTRIYQHVDAELQRITIEKLPELRTPKEKA